MTTVNPKTGSDTWIRDDHPNRPMSGGNRIRLKASHRKGLVHVPLTNIRGRTVVSAVLVGHVRSGFTSQTVTAHLALEAWRAGSATWLNPREGGPNVGAHVDTALSGPFSDGDAVELDILTIVQSVASGAAVWRGLVLTTSATADGDSDWYAFDSGKPSWELAIELSDTPDAPTNLHPTGDNVGSSAPVVDWQPFDLGGDAFSQGAFQVQTQGDSVFDSGWVDPGLEPELDLSTVAFTPLTSGQSFSWRVRIRDASGTNTSPWSDWTEDTTYTPYADLVPDSPTGGTIGDATPTVEAHLVGETLKRWRVRVLDAAHETLWDSEVQRGPFSIDVPWRDPDTGKRILKRDDATYLFDLRAWGDVPRADAVGLPSYVRELVSVVYDDDIGVAAPDAFTVTQLANGDPRLLFSWHRTEDADGWLLIRDGEIVERLDSDEVTNVAGTYSWTDSGLSQPYKPHTWTVRAVESGHRSVASNAVTKTVKPVGAWLVPVDVPIDPIMVRGITSLDQFARLDNRATYSIPATGEDVDIVYSQQGISGTFDGTVADDSGKPRHALDDVDRLQALAREIGARVRFVWATQSIPVILRDLSALPSSTFDDASRRHRVTFGFRQIGD